MTALMRFQPSPTRGRADGKARCSRKAEERLIELASEQDQEILRRSDATPACVLGLVIAEAIGGAGGVICRVLGLAAFKPKAAGSGQRLHPSRTTHTREVFDRSQLTAIGPGGGWVAWKGRIAVLPRFAGDLAGKSSAPRLRRLEVPEKAAGRGRGRPPSSAGT